MNIGLRLGAFVEDGGEDTVGSMYCGEDTVAFFFFSFLRVDFAVVAFVVLGVVVIVVVVVVEEEVVDEDAAASALADFLLDAVVVVVLEEGGMASVFRKCATS